jgi:hypothetical protein
MHENAFSYSHLESHAPGAVLAPGQHILGGWVMPRPGGHFVDVRARLGDRIFPGILGWPRADLAAHFQTGRPVALAEFKIVVELPPGPSALLLEVLEIEGRWSVFQSVRLEADATLPPTAVAMPSGPPLRWHEYGRALQLLLWAARREPARPLAELARGLVASIPCPRDLRHPHPPFKGHLDEPAALVRSGFGRVPVLGYLFHESLPIKRVLATFDLQVWQTIEHGLPSGGPANYYPEFPHAARCGLYGVIDAPAQLPPPLCLRLYAELPDGSLHLCAVQRGLPYTNEEEKSPYPARAAVTVAAANEALQSALAAADRALIRDAEFAAELARIEADFARRAPARLSPVPPIQPAPLRSTTPLPRSALLVTHNLNHEGAPLFFLDYARHLAAQGVAVTVLSPADGPLRARFAEFARAILLVDAGPVFAAADAGAARAALDAVKQAVDFPAYELVVCNTFTTFWAVHAAQAAGRRVLLYVHESTTPASFYAGRVAPAVVALVEQAFGLAHCVSFTTASTRRITATTAAPRITGSPRAGSKSPGLTPGGRSIPAPTCAPASTSALTSCSSPTSAPSATARASISSPAPWTCSGNATRNSPPAPASSCLAAATPPSMPCWPTSSPNSAGPTSWCTPPRPTTSPITPPPISSCAPRLRNLPRASSSRPWSVKFPCSAPACKACPSRPATDWRPPSSRPATPSPSAKAWRASSSHPPSDAISPPAPAPAWSPNSTPPGSCPVTPPSPPRSPARSRSPDRKFTPCRADRKCPERGR